MDRLLAIVLFVISAAFLSLILKNFWLNPAETILKKYVEEPVLKGRSILLSDLVSAFFGQDRDYSFVCILGSYQNKIKISSDKENIFNSDGLRAINVINQFLKNTQLRSDEGSWNILLLNNKNEVDVIKIRNKNAFFGIENEFIQYCLPYENSAFRKVKLDHSMHEFEITLINKLIANEDK